jgi:ribonuclease VapC
MIAVDTSALMAILLAEPEADACIAALETADEVLISAGTLAEALIVATRRSVGDEMTRLVDGFGFVVVPVTAASTRRMAQAYADAWCKARGAHQGEPGLAPPLDARALPRHAARSVVHPRRQGSERP